MVVGSFCVAGGFGGSVLGLRLDSPFSGCGFCSFGAAGATGVSATFSGCLFSGLGARA